MAPEPAQEEGRLLELLAMALQCLEEDGPDRLEAFLREHPADATTLRERLAVLAESGLVQRGADADADAFPARLGEFRLKERLGSGGMGVVYLAEQTSLNRDVALKLIRPEHLFFPQARERFRREIEAVARLEHPGIVRVYSAGQEDGLPYFTMERVDGVSLADLLAELAHQPLARLDEPALYAAMLRLRGAPVPAFAGRRSWVEVCASWIRDLAEALEHAHRHGVLHRDLKPANVMISWTGRVLLLDFGLASTAAATRITRSNAHLGSLPYMAPEQVRGEQDRIDARTDVYSLGVVLYEALTLKSPFAAGAGGDEDVRRRITQTLPVPVRQHNPAVARDVETVCATAMAPEPERRYRSAADLARDLQNVLDLRPIEARRATPGLRLRRLVRRHPAAAVAVVAGFLLLAVAPTVVAALEYRARQQVVKARDAAELEASTREEILRFLNDDLLAAVAPGAVGKDASMRAVLDVAARKIEGRFPDRPRVEAAVRATLGETYRRLGVLDEAERHLTRARALRRQHDGPTARVTLADDRRWGMVVLARGRTEEAIAADRATWQTARASFGDEDPDTLASANNLGLALCTGGHFVEAEHVLRHVVETRLRLLGEEHQHTQVSMSNLGLLYTRWGKLDQAEPWVRRELELCRRTNGEEHVDTLISLHNHASLLERLERFEEALATLERVVAVSRKVRGESHQSTLNNGITLAVILTRLSRLEEAEARLRAVIAAGAALPDHPHVLRARVHLGDVLRRRREPAEAGRVLELAAADCRRALGEDHLLALYARTVLARWLEEQARPADAAAELRAVLAAYGDRQAADVAAARVLLARVLRAQGEADAAAREARAALAWLEAHAPRDPIVRDALRELIAQAEERRAADAVRAWSARLQEWETAHQQAKASR